MIALRADGLLTGAEDLPVRRHRALPGADEWLHVEGGTGVLRALGHGILAVVTPHRAASPRTRIADGGLRRVRPVHASRAFRAERAVRRGARRAAGPADRPAVHTGRRDRAAGGPGRPRADHPGPYAPRQRSSVTISAARAERTDVEKPLARPR
ncbi:hypothetical protein ACWC0C_24500 [Streptomyces sp. NPDC001709]